MKYKILGVIGILWGGAVILSHLLGGGGSSGSGAYQSGQMAGLVFAAGLIVAGGVALAKSGDGNED